MEIYVGELQENWKFPSDHMPVGIRIDNVNIASWNVLDTAYIDWVIEKNSQGLSHSLIAKENVPIENSKLTLRDRHVVDLMLQMLHHPSYPKHLLSIQESGEPFLKELKTRLPKNFTIIADKGNAIVINNLCFEILQAQSVNHVFSKELKRSFQDITLQHKDSDKKLRIINTHLPGDPAGPARIEFAKYLVKTLDPTSTTIAMGDMNFNEQEMQEALNQAQDIEEFFSLYSPNYHTNISPYIFTAKTIDHFIIHSTIKPTVLTAEQVMIECAETVNLLTHECFKSCIGL